METSHVILLLIELHKSIFQHAILNARGKTEIPLFSIQAPGNIGVDKIEVPNINLDPNSLPDDIKSQIVKIFSTSQIGKNYPLERNGIKPGVFDSFLNGISQGQYDPSSVGVTILMIIDEFLEFLSLNDAIFQDMLNGIKPS